MQIIQFYFKNKYDKSQINQYTFYETIYFMHEDFKARIEDKKEQMQMSILSTVVLSEEGSSQYHSILETLDQYLYTPAQLAQKKEVEQEAKRSEAQEQEAKLIQMFGSQM